tara:strand:+ start:205 stop:465 length:261 start_codon:yes stop_codon:yes gene_type:complete
MIKFIRFTTKGGREDGIEIISRTDNIFLRANHTNEYKGKDNEWRIFAQKTTPNSGHTGYYVTEEEFERVAGLLVKGTDKGNILEKF